MTQPWRIRIFGEDYIVKNPESCVSDTEIVSEVNGVLYQISLRLAQGYMLVSSEHDPQPQKIMLRSSRITILADATQIEVWLDWFSSDQNRGSTLALATPELPFTAQGLKKSSTARSLIKSPLTGKILSLSDVDSQVTKGDTLVVIESMKMENKIYAPNSGTITEVFIAAGQAVKAGDRLLSLAPYPLVTSAL